MHILLELFVWIFILICAAVISLVLSALLYALFGYSEEKFNDNFDSEAKSNDGYLLFFIDKVHYTLFAIIFIIFQLYMSFKIYNEEGKIFPFIFLIIFVSLHLIYLIYNIFSLINKKVVSKKYPNIYSLLCNHIHTDFSIQWERLCLEDWERMYRDYPEAVTHYVMEKAQSINQVVNRKYKLYEYFGSLSIDVENHLKSSQQRINRKNEFEDICKFVIRNHKGFIFFLNRMKKDAMLIRIENTFAFISVKIILENKDLINEYERKVKTIEKKNPLFYKKYVEKIISPSMLFQFPTGEIRLSLIYIKYILKDIPFVDWKEQQFDEVEQNLKRVEYLKQKYPESIRFSKIDNLIASQQFSELSKMANIPNEKWQEEEDAIYILYQEVKNRTAAIYPHGYKLWEKMRDKRDLKTIIDTIKHIEEEYRIWEDIFVKHLYNIKNRKYSDTERFLEKQFDLEKWESYKNTVQFIKKPDHSEREDVLSLIPKYFRSDSYINNIPYRYYFKYRPNSVQFLSQTEVKIREIIFAFKNNGEHKDILATIKKTLSELFNSIDNELIQLRHINPSSSRYFVFVCIPSSSQKDYEKRCKDFSAELCKDLGMVDGFPYLKVVHDTTPTHSGGNRDDIRVSYDDTFFRGKHVILFDDIVTTGATMTKYINLMTSLGAKVDYVISFAKTFS